MKTFQILLNDKPIAHAELSHDLLRRYDVSDKHIAQSLPHLIKKMRELDPPYTMELRIDEEVYYQQKTLLAHSLGEAKLLELTGLWQETLAEYVARLEKEVEQMESQITSDDERYYSMFTDRGNLAVHQLYYLLLEVAKMPEANQAFMREAAKKGLELIGHEAQDSDVEQELSAKLETAWGIRDQQEYRLYFDGFDEAKRRGFAAEEKADHALSAAGAEA